MRKISSNENIPKFKLSTLIAITINAYAKGNIKKVFLKPVENSNGFFEKGVGIVKFTLIWKEISANAIEHKNKYIA